MVALALSASSIRLMTFSPSPSARRFSRSRHVQPPGHRWVGLSIALGAGPSRPGSPWPLPWPADQERWLGWPRAWGTSHAESAKSEPCAAGIGLSVPDRLIGADSTTWESGDPGCCVRARVVEDRGPVVAGPDVAY